MAEQINSSKVTTHGIVQFTEMKSLCNFMEGAASKDWLAEHTYVDGRDPKKLHLINCKGCHPLAKSWQAKQVRDKELVATANSPTETETAS